MRNWRAELDAALVVQLFRRGKVKIGEQHPPDSFSPEDPHSIPAYRVILRF
jgi:hypothetical protein